MTEDAPPPRVARIVGVYDADGGVLGELRYAAGAAFARRHCALCDLTHRGVRPRADWNALVSDVEAKGAALLVLHRNEQPESVRAVTKATGLPVIVAEVAGSWSVVLDGDALARCRGDLTQFSAALNDAINAHGWSL